MLPLLSNLIRKSKLLEMELGVLIGRSKPFRTIVNFFQTNDFIFYFMNLTIYSLDICFFFSQQRILTFLSFIFSKIWFIVADSL